MNWLDTETFILVRKVVSVKPEMLTGWGCMLFAICGGRISLVNTVQREWLEWEELSDRLSEGQGNGV